MNKIISIWKNNKVSLNNLKSIVSSEKIMVLLFGIVVSRVVLFEEICPICIAYYLSVVKDKKRRLYALVGSVIGLGTVNDQINILKYVSILVLISLIQLVSEKRKIEINLLGQALIGVGSTFAINIILFFAEQMSIFYLTTVVLESALVFIIVYVFKKVMDVLVYGDRRQVYSEEEVIGLVFLVGFISAGLAGIYILGVDVQNIISFYIVMLLAYNYGASKGSMIGLILGFCITMSKGSDAQLLVILAGSGLLCGVFKELGKIAATVGFSSAIVILSYYFGGTNIDMEIIKGLSMSVILFLITPKKFLEKVDQNFLVNKKINGKEYLKRVQQLTSEKLKLFSLSFESLAKTFSNISEEKTTLSQREITKIFDQVAERVCNNCSNCKLCWEKDFYYTYQIVYSILDTAQQKGKIEKKDIPSDFFARCKNSEDFIITVNRIYEIYRVNLSWYNRLIENRKLVSGQLSGISKVIDNLSEEVYEQFIFDEDMENLIVIELDKNNIEIQNVIVIKNKKGNYEVSIKLKTYADPKKTKKLVHVVSKILNKNMKLKQDDAIYKNDIKNYNVEIVEQKKYKVTSAVAVINKSKKEVSGDNYTFKEVKDGTYLLAISDGMGSGDKANKESKTTIELLEQFLETGFEKEIAVKLINSVLILKSNEDMFSTLDFATINLFNGVCEFTKIGASTAFIVSGKEVETIKSTSLPVGMIDEIDIEEHIRRLYNNDLIIMVTDGVIDSGEDGEKIINSYLQNKKSNDPKCIAQELLDAILQDSGDKIMDDMTILVSRIYKD